MKSGMQTYFFLASFCFQAQRLSLSQKGPGSGIRDPGSKKKNGSRIPDPGGKKAPDPRAWIRIRNTEGSDFFSSQNGLLQV
jgi:hypothetical protein